nr:MAG TPA: hypothetical protein [Caudoviricetes sp.]
MYFYYNFKSTSIIFYRDYKFINLILIDKMINWVES